MIDTKYTKEEEQIAVFSKALSHPTRVAILNFLASLDTCYFGEINNELSISKATVSQHLTELKNAGLIQGTIEYPKVKYCINKENWETAKKVFEKFFNQKSNQKNKCK
ncbi:MAG: winged helix-turn-helix domain-containing protein [Candidatus Paceibacterota bacterium]|jgi:DNA-binding transcriptional ArsR family regulator